MLKDILIKNRSIRSFEKSVKIEKEELLEMIECTRYCPSSANLQALKFMPVYKDEKVSEVFKNTKWAGYLSHMEIPPKGKEPTAFIIVLHDKNIAPNPIPFYKDTGIVSHTILLKATEMGYGGCMIGSFNKSEIKESLNISENLEITLVIALGKSTEEPEICESTGDIKYFREGDKHYVPKRSLQEIIVE